jgi:lysophospholipase L1-like esterase
MPFRSACTLILIAALLPGAWAQTATSKKKHPATAAKTSVKAKPTTVKRAPIQKLRPTKKRRTAAPAKTVHGGTRVTTASTHVTRTTETAPVIAVAVGAPGPDSRTWATVTKTAPSRETTIARLTADLASPRVGIEFASNLRPFFDQLRALEQAPQSGTVRIFQFGDSHTAADLFTGALRTLFQTRFGDAGPGFSLAGYPFAGYRIHGTKHAQSTGWLALGTHLRDIGDALVGMGGVSLSTDKPGNWVSLETEAVSLDVHYLIQPGGGQFEIYDGDQLVATVSTDGPESAGTKSLTVAPGPHHFEVRTIDYNPIRLLGMVAEKPFGVTYDAMGLNGAEASLLLRWNQDLLGTYLQQREPNLIVLAYGTNEAADHSWTEESYATMFRSLIERFHTMSPGVPILVVGPADRDLRAGRRKWAPFIGTDRIIAAQRSVCRQMHCAYWNQQARMGGFGSMHEWVAVDWAQGDHTHFTGEGYTELASALFSDIVTQYNTYEGINPAAGSSAQ